MSPTKGLEHTVVLTANLARLPSSVDSALAKVSVEVDKGLHGAGMHLYLRMVSSLHLMYASVCTRLRASRRTLSELVLNSSS